MKKFAFFTAIALIAASASRSYAFYPVTYFRCTADQLLGHPSEPLENRTGFGRRTWATTANNFYRFSVTPPDTGSAARFWIPSLFDPDVANAIEADIDLYPVYIDNSSPAQPLFVGPGPNNATWFGTTFTQISHLPFTGAFNLPIGVKVDALCEAGCYSPEQQIRVGDGFVPVAEAQASGQSHRPLDGGHRAGQAEHHHAAHEVRR